MASSRATTALAAVLVVALLATLAVGTGVFPFSIGPDRIEATPEPFATTATTTSGSGAPATATEPTTAATLGSTTDESVADAPPPTETPSITPTATGTGVATTETPAAGGVATDATTATPGATPADRRYERARVTITDANGTDLATVRTWIADTEDKRYTGLSNTESLRNGTGMLFVYGGESDRTYVMRDMDYPIDIVFIGADRRINEIASAPAPDPGQDGESIRRSGSAKWVLEVPRGWMNATGVGEGDRITIDRSG